MNVETDLLEWHEAMDAYTGPRPEWPSDQVVSLRTHLIVEEFAEVMKELTNRDNLAALAKELCDLVYVTVGAAVAMGIPFDECWAEVHRSNMEKVGAPRRADGKILKPPGWLPPDIAKILDEADKF